MLSPTTSAANRGTFVESLPRVFNPYRGFRLGVIPGVFSCFLVLHCCLGAKRLSPEVMVFLTSALSHFTWSPSTQVILGKIL